MFTLKANLASAYRIKSKNWGLIILPSGNIGLNRGFSWLLTCFRPKKNLLEFCENGVIYVAFCFILELNRGNRGQILSEIALKPVGLSCK